MRRRDEEVSSQHRVKRPLAIALGAIFLLAGIGIIGKVLPDSSPAEINMLLLGQVSNAGANTHSAQIRSDQAVAAESPELILFGKTSVAAVTPTMTVTPRVLGAILGGADLNTQNRREIVHYIVEEGDTLDVLAERFGISVNTIAWANDLSATAQLSLGEELMILPVSGALHLVRPGDTLSEISLWYRADVEEILEFNDIESAQDIFVGDLLIVPNGRKPAKVPSGRLTPLANSYFIMPVPRAYRVTQGLHPYNAVDLANGTCGSPVYAAAGGLVQSASQNSGLGNYVRILHPNGVVTVYAHLSGQTVSASQKVLQGEIVGYVGHTGYTIPAGSGGCHLHFEVRGASNPFAK